MTVTLTLSSQAAALASFQVSHLPALGQDNYEARRLVQPQTPSPKLTPYPIAFASLGQWHIVVTGHL